MNIEDKKLLDIYVLGWNDSSKNKPRFNQFSGIEHKAYQLGWCDFIIGDEVSSVDYQSDDKILSNIKNNVMQHLEQTAMICAVQETGELFKQELRRLNAEKLSLKCGIRYITGKIHDAKKAFKQGKNQVDVSVKFTKKQVLVIEQLTGHDILRTITEHIESPKHKRELKTLKNELACKVAKQKIVKRKIAILTALCSTF